MPVEKQVGLITLETTIHRRGEGFEVHMIRTGIMRILIEAWVEIRFLVTEDAK